MARRVSCLLGLAHMVWSLGPLFSCRLKVATEGRAIAVVGLEEALAEQASKATVHCTILWRREGFTSKEVQEVQAFANEWLQERGRSPEDVCHFSLEEWGHRSKLVEGELKDFVLEARKHFEAKWDLKPLEGRRGAVHVELHSAAEKRSENQTLEGFTFRALEGEEHRNVGLLVSFSGRSSI